MNTRTRLALGLPLAAALALAAACDTSSDAASGAAAPAPAVTAEAAPKSRGACDWATAEQISAIVGTSLRAEAASGAECSYTPGDGSGLPMVQLAVELGSAEAAMTATGMLGRIEPGMTNPYEGVGDQASIIGPAVWIRRGDDLVRITVMGIETHDVAVRQIFSLVDAAL